MSRTPVAARQAAREAIGRALEADLTMREMKIFLATLQLVANFDNVEDRVANRQYADATGIDERHVRRALHSLAAKGVIRREVGSGRRASLVSLDVEGAEVARARMAPQGGPILTLRGADLDT